jgi:hypothetical protein
MLDLLNSPGMREILELNSRGRQYLVEYPWAAD